MRRYLGYIMLIIIMPVVTIVGLVFYLIKKLIGNFTGFSRLLRR
ncbi:MAG: hypothetical protein JG781_2687 [Peptococcaceae bacterium]|jgi:hypothetical protein|nr:hypothetical protein [Peptococcaceae bacterium]